MKKSGVTYFTWTREIARTPAERLPHPIAQANP